MHGARMRARNARERVYVGEWACVCVCRRVYVNKERITNEDKLGEWCCDKQTPYTLPILVPQPLQSHKG